MTLSLWHARRGHCVQARTSDTHSTTSVASLKKRTKVSVTGTPMIRGLCSATVTTLIVSLCLGLSVWKTSEKRGRKDTNTCSQCLEIHVSVANFKNVFLISRRKLNFRWSW